MISVGTKVVVTTQYRGVFFGTIREYQPESQRMILSDARNCLYWPQSEKGFIGLAKVGPLNGSRVGPCCDQLDLYGVTSVSLCTDEAISRWESGPWS